MQAYEGYIDNGRFVPRGNMASLKGRHKVIMTVLEEMGEDEKNQASWKLMSELIKSERTAEEKGWLSEEEADAIISIL